MRLAGKLWQRCRNLLPVSGFYFDRPLVLLQSDDWGRVGLRDHEGLEQLRSAGMALGERPYDLYTLETAEDLYALRTTLEQHTDSVGNHPSLEMNFILANLDFGKMQETSWREIHFVALADSLPSGWIRPGLIEAYCEGIEAGIFCPALHGMSHFCRTAVERNTGADDERRNQLHTLWRAGTPYIHWRMPWIGYEYWDPEQTEDERFLSAELQRESIGQAVGAFARMFSSLPRSACAPGYRANDDTHDAWAKHGIRTLQNGPAGLVPPHFDRHGLLNLTRTVEFEPATNPDFSLERCLAQAERCFSCGIPAIVSVHSINFHSTVRNFRDTALRYLEEFLSALESKHTDLLYIHDEDLHELVKTGACRAERGSTQLNVITKKFSKASVSRDRLAGRTA